MNEQAERLRIGLVGFGTGGLYFHEPFIEAAEGVELVGVVGHPLCRSASGSPRTVSWCSGVRFAGRPRPIGRPGNAVDVLAVLDAARTSAGSGETVAVTSPSG